MRLIAICANGPRAGKTTTAGFCASYLLTTGGYNSVVVSLAQPIKDLAREHFGWNGEKDERGRQLLLNLGTVTGRAYDPNIWLNKWQDRVIDSLSSFKNSYVLCDDLRFENEYAMIKRMGGIIIRVERPGCDKPGMIGETFVPSDDLVDYRITNEDSEKELNDKIRTIVEELLDDGKNNKEGVE